MPQSLARLHIHLVFSTKNREPIITDGVRDALHAYMATVLQNLGCAPMLIYSEAGLAQSKLWPKGTICITIAANIAETAILGFDACFPDSVIGVVANPKEAEVGFIEYLLQSFKARLQALGKGSAQANINMGTFENEHFPFPPVFEQRQIVAKLDALSTETTRLAAIYQQKLAALEALKKSLLHQAFSGEL